MFNYILFSSFYYSTLVIIEAFLNTVLPQNVLYVYTITSLTFPQSFRMCVCVSVGITHTQMYICHHLLENI